MTWQELAEKIKDLEGEAAVDLESSLKIKDVSETYLMPKFGGCCKLVFGLTIEMSDKKKLMESIMRYLNAGCTSTEVAERYL